MKLSEMNTTTLAKALCTMAKPLGEICEDDAFRALMKKGKETSFGVLISEATTLLLDKHFPAMMKILSVLTDKTEEELRNQNGLQTISDMMACMDKDLIDFFMPSAQLEQTE